MFISSVGAQNNFQRLHCLYERRTEWFDLLGIKIQGFSLCNTPNIKKLSVCGGLLWVGQRYPFNYLGNYWAVQREKPENLKSFEEPFFHMR